MDTKDSLGYYLKGALAGKLIESPAKIGACRGCFKDAPKDQWVYISSPETVTVGSEVAVCVRVNNVRNVDCQGRVQLVGEDLAHNASYEFQAPFTLQQGSDGVCITFSWRPPRYATRVQWSATVTIEARMGVDLPTCSGTTIVTSPLH